MDEEQPLHSNCSTTGGRSTVHPFVGVEIHFHCRDSPAIQDLPGSDLRDRRGNGLPHVIRLPPLPLPLPKPKREREMINGTRIPLAEKRREKRDLEGRTYDEKDRIRGLGPDRGIDGILDLAR